MRFRQQQEQARAATRKLLALFALTVLFTVAGVNAALALAWRLQFGGFFGYPNWFFETNTALTLGFVLGGAWLESLRLRDGGAHVARMVGGREVATPQGMAERRLRNIVDEMAIASGLKSPRVFVLDREPTINALAAGWEQQDSVVVVTRGALDRLTRDELQGVVAHEFAHILNGDTRLNMRLIGMVFGLQMVFNFGRDLMSSVDTRGRRGPALAIGAALALAGSVGWLAGRLLRAGVSRQREHLADAFAVQFTRQPTGLGNALRKVAGQVGRGERMASANAEVVSHLLLSADAVLPTAWLASHPPIQERLRRIFGRDMPPLPDDPLPQPEAGGPALPAFEFSAMPALAQVTATGLAGSGQAAAPEAAASPLEAPLFELSATTMPGPVHAAVLACLVPPQSAAEMQAWRRAVPDQAAHERLLQSVQSLPPRRRLPWFERLLRLAAALPAPDRAALVGGARAVAQADGRVSLAEYLEGLVLQRQLGMHGERLSAERRGLALAELAHPVALVSRALAASLSVEERARWLRAVHAGLRLPPAGELPMPSAGELAAALDRLVLLGRMERPALVKQWIAGQPLAGWPQRTHDALRCLCLLIDTPLPPPLAAQFDPLPLLPETA
ncbi:M48 family metalloprotease [Ramlibacter sp. RBP-2]|uniref:M48 family metalloprotease n=1 Tax=Ramlibacter lithotrophicus TaxID=2606681 RepID=A0A7X6I6R2_9BURK|nr:M48 family metalloprotease [Ramlibacter lithotrophicus]NKE66520.1 M48 family metalloprotease [Ramlibacter lithotrophicus]